MVCELFEQCRTIRQNKDTNCEHCRQIQTGSKVVCSEKKSRYILKNPDNIAIVVFHIDGGVIRNEDNCQKCDYLYDINTHSTSAAIFIELKGKHITDALEQIENSVKLLAHKFPKSYCLYGRIVCSRVPKIYDAKANQIRKSLKNLGVDVQIKENFTDEVKTFLKFDS